MLEDWEVDNVAEENGNASAIPDQYLRRNREQFSTPHTAGDPNKIDEIELESENLQGMIRHPPKVGAVRFHHEPESTNTSHASVTATTFQGTTSNITARGSYQQKGARWHLRTTVFSNVSFCDFPSTGVS